MTFDPKDSLGFQCVQTYKAFEKALGTNGGEIAYIWRW